jgi:cell division protein FtsI (penicillin-binding protein 3)
MMQRRILAVACGVAVLFAVVAGRIVDLTFTQSPMLRKRADAQHVTSLEVRAQRGLIVDRHGETMASSVTCPSIYVRPGDLGDRPAVAGELAAPLGMRPAEIARKLASTQPFVWLKRTVTPRERDAVRALAVSGVGELQEARRFYPHRHTAAHVLGIAGVDLQGLEGIELVYDRELRAARRKLVIERDARGRPILVDGAGPAVERGATVELTIDMGLQTIVEEVLEAHVTKARARAGTVIVLDPWTGEILALANAPTFDPNEGGRAPTAARRNRAVTDVYEPGSTFKALLAAAAIEERVVRPNELIFCENGRLRVGRRTVHDSHPHEWLTFSEVIQVSSNIGSAKVGARLGRERYHAFLTSLELGTPSGVDLPGEIGGLMRSVGNWKPIDLTTASYGQGIAVTPLQMTRAFAAIANGGLLVKPYVARRAVTADGTVLWERGPTIVRRVMREATADVVTSMLERVVEDGGTGTRARVSGVRVAGKTGTAQKIDPGTGRYSARGRIASFVGFLPAEAPQLVILALVDEPQGTTYGGMVAAPIFQEIAAAAMARAGLPVPEAPPAWPEGGGDSAPAVAVAATTSGVPSFLGESLRSAVARARALGWMVEIQGAGYVTSQSPPPGAPVAPGKALVLALTPLADIL